jgi:hypothetical protein
MLFRVYPTGGKVWKEEGLGKVGAVLVNRMAKKVGFGVVWESCSVGTESTLKLKIYQKVAPAPKTVRIVIH